MPSNKLPRTIPARPPSCRDGLALQVVSDISGELSDGGVAAVGLFAERLEDDRVEVAPKRPREFPRFWLADRPDVLVCEPGQQLFHELTRSLGFGHPDRHRQLVSVLNGIGQTTGEQEAQQNTKRIDVRRRRSRLA